MEYLMAFLIPFITGLPVALLIAGLVIGLGVLHDKMARRAREAWLKGQQGKETR
jgi:hypothetical protein